MALGLSAGCGVHGLDRPSGAEHALTATSTLVVEHSMKCLDLPGGAAGDNINLQQWHCHGGSNQVFSIAEIAGDPGFHTITTSTGGCLDVPSGSTADNIFIQQYHCHGGDNQRWSLNSIGGGAYEIRPKLAPSKCLDVWAGDTADGTPVQQFTCHGNRGDQAWHITLPAPPSTPPPAPPASPSFTLSASPTSVTAVWGQSANVQVSISAQGGFSGSVALSLVNPPSGVNYSFSSSAIGVGQTSTLTLTPAPGQTALRQVTTLSLRGTSPGVSTPAPISISLSSRRVPGPFVEVFLRGTTSDCTFGGQRVTARVTGTNLQFLTAGGSAITGSMTMGAGYAFSPSCRVAVVIPPNSGSFLRYNAFNLTMPSSVASFGPGWQILGEQGNWQNFLFSPDDTILLVVGASTVGPTAQVVNMYNMTTGGNPGREFFTGSNMSAELTPFPDNHVNFHFQTTTGARTISWSAP